MDKNDLKIAEIGGQKDAIEIAASSCLTDHQRYVYDVAEGEYSVTIAKERTAQIIVLIKNDGKWSSKKGGINESFTGVFEFN